MDSRKQKTNAVHKVPGTSAMKEKYVKNLDQLTLDELLVIKQREEYILTKNKCSLTRLPDKGKRILEYYEKVLAELDRRYSIDEAAAMFSELNIAAKGKHVLNNLEWQGKLNNGLKSTDIDDVLDSDDEYELDPLKVLAQKSMHTRRVKILPPPKSLITKQDLEDIENFNAETINAKLSESENKSTDVQAPIDADIIEIDVASKVTRIKPLLEKLTVKDESLGKDDLNVEQHALYLMEIAEQTTTQQREKFKPYKTTKSNVHDVEKERNRKMGKHWEITAATPPPIKNNAAQLLSLADSVQLQSDYLARLKELQLNQAQERLARQAEYYTEKKLQVPNASVLQNSAAFQKYRDNISNFIEGDLKISEEDEERDSFYT